MNYVLICKWLGRCWKGPFCFLLGRRLIHSLNFWSVQVVHNWAPSEHCRAAHISDWLMRRWKTQPPCHVTVQHRQGLVSSRTFSRISWALCWNRLAAQLLCLTLSLPSHYRECFSTLNSVFQDNWPKTALVQKEQKACTKQKFIELNFTPLLSIVE